MTIPDSAGSNVANGSVASRDSSLAEVFVRFADTLVDDFDIVALMDDLVRTSVDLLGATAAGLLLSDQRGKLRLVASSSENVRVLELFQLQSDEGPCLDCVHTGKVVKVDDLGAAADRWPRFTSAAAEAGYHSVYALPMRLRDQTIGGLNLFRAETPQLSPEEQRVAQALADIATIGILQQRSIHRASLLAEQLQSALNSRVVIEQAKGVLKEYGRVDLAAAYAALRWASRDRNIKIGELAQAVVRGEVGLDEVLKAANRPGSSAAS